MIRTPPIQSPLVLAFIAWLLFACTQPAGGQEFQPGWRLHLDLAVVNASGDFVAVDVGGAGVDVDFDSAVGAGLRGEYRFSELLGVEIGVLGAGSVDVKAGVFDGGVGTAVGVNSFSPVSLGLNFHLTADSPVDVYAGPLLAIVNYGDVDVETGIGGATTSVSVDSDVGWGAIVGLDVPIGSRGWTLQTNVRFIETSLKGSHDDLSFDSNFDPFIFSLGVGYRF